MNYVASIKKRKASRLFPQLKNSDHGYGSAVGLWFVKFIRSIGLKDRSLVLHSTRHTFITRLHAAGAPTNLVEVLVGHASKSVHGKVYVHREDIPLKMLSEALERLQYPAVKALLFPKSPCAAVRSRLRQLLLGAVPHVARSLPRVHFVEVRSSMLGGRFPALLWILLGPQR